jgi:hypothetical protein
MNSSPAYNKAKVWAGLFALNPVSGLHCVVLDEVDLLTYVAKASF